MRPATVRRATLRDLDLLVRHRRRMWEDIGGFTEPQLVAADPVYRRWARARLRSKSLVGWIVMIDGVAVASGCVWIQQAQPNPRWPNGRQPYLLSMFTEPEYRGRGLAKQIVAVATEWCRGQGHARFTLHASPAGLPIYESLGWQRTREMAIELPPARRPARRRRVSG